MDSSERLKEVRVKFDLSIRDVAEALGVAPSVVSNWETGVSSIRKPNALAIQTVYGVRWQWLMLGEEPMMAPPLSRTKTLSDAAVVPLFETCIEFEEDGERPDQEKADGSRMFRYQVLSPLLLRAGGGNEGTLALFRVPPHGGLDPLFPPGSLVLLNTSSKLRTQPPQGAVVLIQFNGVHLLRRAFPMSPRPWEDGALPTSVDDPLARPTVYPVPEETEAAWLKMVQGVVVL
jgi:transcriptional regulator with XRE-family HTH domain